MTVSPPSLLFSSSPVPFHNLPTAPIHSLSFPFRKVEAFYVYQHTMICLLTARLGTSSHIKLGGGNPLGGKVPRAGNRVRESPCSLCQGSHKKTKPTTAMHVQRAHGNPTQVLWLAVQSP